MLLLEVDTVLVKTRSQALKSGSGKLVKQSVMLV